MGRSEPSAPPHVSVRLALALQGACVAAVALYAILRLVQAVLFKEPNPATVIWSAHAGYFWRAWTVAYAGAMTAFGAFAASERHASSVCRVLVAGLTVAAALLAIQGVLVP